MSRIRFLESDGILFHSYDLPEVRNAPDKTAITSRLSKER